MVRHAQSGTNPLTRGGRGGRRRHLNRTHAHTSDNSEEDREEFQAAQAQEEDNESEDNEENLRDLAKLQSQPPSKRTKINQNIEMPTLQNYRQLANQWGKSRAENILAAQPRTHNCLSPNGLLEAQALQSKYDLHKTMLALSLGCSRPTLDAALFERPLAQEPNGYTNYQTYSNTATKTDMPPRGMSSGFGDQNTIVGYTWTQYTLDQKMVFNPEYFERLCKACIPNTTSDIITQCQDHSSIPPEDPLTNEELEKYVLIFKELANLEDLMKTEIKRIVKQRFKLQFHLLLGSWNPNNTGPRALYKDKYTSCGQWALTQRTEQRLLECFVRTATHAPLSVRIKSNNNQTLSAAAVAQIKLQKELSHHLNSLVYAHLSGPITGRGDSHPKVPNPHLALAKKTFRGKVKLAVQLSPDCKIDRSILAKGANAGALKDRKIHLWLDDIRNGRYQVVKTNTPLSQSDPPPPSQAEPAPM
ncbi:hypothetical protein DFH28DRAFT_1090439 [Melampsora americana]|nr:hypothetical protein DFH28DRAFT_1090439 [Melampsora americana]